MAFLSQNHCLETLEFTLDASRYQTYYYSLPQIPPIPGSDEATRLRTSWDRLINSYIRPGSMREVNLPSADRDFLLRIPNTYTPPSPSALDGAVFKINELMRESVLSPFLQACQEKMCQESQERQQLQQQQQLRQQEMMFSNPMNVSLDDRMRYTKQVPSILPQQRGDMEMQMDPDTFRQQARRSQYGGNLQTLHDQMQQQQQQRETQNQMQHNMRYGQEFQAAAGGGGQYLHHMQSDTSQPQHSQSGLSQLFNAHGRGIRRPTSARPTSVPSADFLPTSDSWSANGDLDSEMSGSEDPITPPHTPPASMSPGMGAGQWRSKIKNQFSKMNSNRAKSREVS